MLIRLFFGNIWFVFVFLIRVIGVMAGGFLKVVRGWGGLRWVGVLGFRGGRKKGKVKFSLGGLVWFRWSFRFFLLF